MNTIRVSKELLINLGNFSNIKIVAEITKNVSEESPDVELSDFFNEAWKELNEQVAEQEAVERQRLAPKPAPKTEEVIF